MGSVSWIVMTSGPLQKIGNVGVALGNKVGVLNLWPGVFLISVVVYETFQLFVPYFRLVN